jgi:hypothetical protein
LKNPSLSFINGTDVFFLGGKGDSINEGSYDYLFQNKVLIRKIHRGLIEQKLPLGKRFHLVVYVDDTFITYR